MIVELIFWISFIALLHSYLLYPMLVRLLSLHKQNNSIRYTNADEGPDVAIIMAVHNEESIIERKIQSVLDSDYPKNKIIFLIGSDASTDGTDSIIMKYADLNQTISFKRFPKRCGKSYIINSLASNTSNEILIFTDAHAIFTRHSIFNLVRHFLNPEIQVVGGRMKNTEIPVDNVSIQEISYFENEYKTKLAEGKLWGTMMGAFGAFYAVRKSAWNPVPENFITDDFYISVKAIEKKGKAILDPEAIVFENVSGNIKMEYQRKARISTGNFQNLKALSHILIPNRFGLAFSFFSHKVLRWFGPFLIALSIISLSFLFRQNTFYTILFIIMLLSLLAPIIDYFHVKFQFHVILLRFITHFYYMNLAILAGFIRYMKGVKSNVWEPTKRN